jgi:hypothetical protein
VGWTWTDPEGRTARHTTRWIRRRMIDQAETNRSTTEPNPEEMQQRLVAVGIGGIAAWWRNASETEKNG